MPGMPTQVRAKDSFHAIARKKQQQATRIMRKTELVTTLKKTTRFCRANSEKHKTKKLPSCTWTDQIRSDWTTDCN